MWGRAEAEGGQGQPEANSGNLVQNRKATELRVMKQSRRSRLDIARWGRMRREGGGRGGRKRGTEEAKNEWERSQELRNCFHFQPLWIFTFPLVFS